ncbi:MAG: NAD-dependent succinate-semialdehyde dehydrogenase [Woeseiaceae bacterium]
MQLESNNLVPLGGWINGGEVVSDATFSIVNPATLQDIASVVDLGAGHTRDAIEAAKQAFVSWKTTPRQERITVLLAWADLIEKNVGDLATIICAESGKPLREAQGEALQCASLLRWYAQVATNLHEESQSSHADGQRNYTIKQPVGVVACITPWNFPAAAVAVKAGAAIATGCTTIVKPSDETPLIALALARLSADAGLPPGVFNVIPCKSPAAVGDELCRNSDVRMLSFTGSTRVGKQLYAACGDTVKRIALELGGNAPFIVFDDADMEKALAGAMGARFYNSGQICVGANRFFIHKNVYRAFTERLAERVAEFITGNGADATSDIGPMINRAAIDRLTELVRSSIEMGAELVTGGKQKDDGQSRFFAPTVLTNMTADMPAARAEIFGPVACLYEFEDEAQVLAEANNTDAGLSAYIYTSDAERLQRFVESLEAGVVGANSANIFANDLPFGGIKHSGLGREHGPQCLDEYIETKSICVGE